MTSPRRRALLATAALILPVAAFAQTQPPQTIPGLEDYSLPGTPTPAPTPTPSPTPTPPLVAIPPASTTPAPAPTRTPTTAPTSTTRPTSTPTRAAPDPEATPAPPPASEPVATPVAPESVPSPAPEPATSTPAPAPTGQQGQGASWWWLGGGLLAGLAALAAWRSLRRRDADEEVGQVEVEQPLPPPPPPLPRAHLNLALRPLRAGINMVTATVEAEVTVTNSGEAPATGVRMGVRLLSGHAGQETDLAAFYGEGIARPAAPPFTLAPGEARTLRAVAVLPHAEIRALTAGGRPIFVPMVAVNARYAAGDGGEGQATQAFAVGVEREGSPKLAPFRLDRPGRTTTEVGARPA